MFSFSNLQSSVKQYVLITGNYWAFTLTDGALRMLVVLHFYQLGYSPLSIAMLFLFYEVFGVVTNLLGGWLGSRFGLNQTMNYGLFVQIIALIMLLVPNEFLTVIWVMIAQALSGIAKDLNKMSAKSAIKLLVPNQSDSNNKLYKWVAILTGSKNAMKGFGFFLGAALLSSVGFFWAAASMAIMLFIILIISVVTLEKNLGKVKQKTKFSHIFSKSKSINSLSLARLFLFGARDVWFVVALPVYFSSQLLWEHWQVGSFMAIWVIGYGIIQSIAPKITGHSPDGRTALIWCLMLSLITLLITYTFANLGIYEEIILVVGLMVFGIFFAINSSLHSYLIVNYSSKQSISMDVGFYYMANASGRLLGTILSGTIYQKYGLGACLLASFAMLVIASLTSLKLPRNK